MKAFVSSMLLIFFAAIVQAQSLADIARAERKRQRSVESRKVVVEVGELKLAPPARAAAVAEIEQPKAEPQKAEQAPAAQPAATDGRKSADDALSKKRSELLVKLGTVIRDREAARKIEEELQQIRKRAAELKVKQEAVPR